MLRPYNSNYVLHLGGHTFDVLASARVNMKLYCEGYCMYLMALPVFDMTLNEFFEISQNNLDILN